MRATTLLEAVESLALIEVAAVSWINLIPIDTHYIAVFTIALLLPFRNTDLSDEFRAGAPRLWPDQKRLVECKIPIQDQILELHRARTLGTLAPIYLAPRESEAQGLWAIKTHSGNDHERLAWMKSVIALEGRSPAPPRNQQVTSFSGEDRP